MNALEFYGLRELGPLRWQFEIVPELSSGRGALFGGCGLGAAVEALERSVDRPLVWATGQFLSYARSPSIVDIEIVEAVRGHRISQARAVCRVDGEEILTVNAALGRRDLSLGGSWALCPDVPAPDDCPPRSFLPRHEGSILTRLDVRLADARDLTQLPGPPGSGRCALWVRMPGLLELTPATLAIVGDYVPFGIGQALGRLAGGNSLDNTLRVAHRASSEWILADVRVHAIVDGFGHGLVHLWSQSGVLLGTASQSTIVRAWEGDVEAARVVAEQRGVRE